MANNGSAPTRWLVLLLLVLGGCASDRTWEVRPAPKPAPTPAARPSSPAPVIVERPQAGPPLAFPGSPSASERPAATTPAPAAPAPVERDGRTLIAQLLPRSVADRGGWTADILTAMNSLQIAVVPENICAALAVIEQESGFQADPQVAGLSRIVWREIDRRRDKVGVPKMVVDLALRKTSPDGRSYKERIDSLRTEKEMNSLYDDMISELPGGKTMFSSYNPVRTGGPMQVRIDFAEEHIRNKPYPYVRKDTVRKEVFTRRGGVYFGIASLLDYPTSYSQMIYRFADFNAGRYSSRNAAFQESVARLSGQPLALDGDLLRYKDGVPAAEASETQRALLALRPRLRLSENEIARDLKLEKSLGFSQTPLYQRLYALAEAQDGARLPRERLPQIRLSSPKISRPLTTEWFARRVDGRYQGCLTRARAAT